MPTPGVAEGRSLPLPGGSLVARGRETFFVSKNHRVDDRGPSAVPFDASRAGCLSGWEQGTGFLLKAVVSELGLKGLMGWPQLGGRVLGVAGTEMGGRLDVGAAETSLGGWWVCEDPSVKVCWAGLGLWRLDAALRFLHLSRTSPSGVLTSLEGTSLGRGRLGLQVSDAPSPRRSWFMRRVSTPTWATTSPSVTPSLFPACPR